MKNETDRLLIIDDDADLRSLLVKRFGQTQLHIDEAHDVAAAKKNLYENVYDLIFSIWSCLRSQAIHCSKC
jgi:DNA-binding response OmpR family regulator